MTPERRIRHDQDLADALDVGESPATDRPRGDGRASRIESSAQMAGVVQRSATGAEEGGELSTDVASRMTSARGSGAPLPEDLRTRMEEKLSYDFSGVRVHTDGESHALARQIGARAFTTGKDIFLGEGASASDEDLMAHELTHVVQQGGDNAAPTKVGAADTSAEGEAAKSAGSLVMPSVSIDDSRGDAGLDAGGSLGKDPAAAPADGEVQRYTDDDQVRGGYARVSENGHVVVLGESNFSQELFASPAMIESAKQKLAASGEQGSYLTLVPTGDKLKHAGHELHKVAPVFKGQGDSDNKGLETKNKGKDEDDKMSLWADCGRSSRVVMGSHGDAAPHATYKAGGEEQDTRAASNPASYSDEIYRKAMPPFLANPGHEKFLKAGIHYGANKAEIIEASSGTEARTQYWELGEEGRRVFDQFAGINTGANPEVGGGYTLNTEYDMPGFKEMGDMTWNFHWAGVVMKDGTDNITLENYADGKGYDSVNTDWNFQMYGTVKKGQTFQEQHLDTNTHGSRGSAFAVEPEGS